ncbi:MAG: DUF5698 domain-containing protein [Bacteroidales bacterium]|jgi:uncharacterized protein YebE (UPF0316 family)|nr:DUF5698 domain-containing protein [Bacteroidales bacterium]
MSAILDQYTYLLPILIFFGRICDVTLGTLRIIFVSKGEKYLAPIIGFFEVLIWITIISEILSRANSIVSYLSYAAGYATGNYVGILIEKRIAYGIVLCKVYIKKNGKDLLNLLNKKDYGATLLHASGSMGDIDIIETIIDRKKLKDVEKIITNFDPEVFFVTEDIRSKQKGIFPVKTRTVLNRWRQGK